MKRLIVLGLIATLVVALAPGADAQKKKKKKKGPAVVQQEEGMVALPAPFTDDSGCFAGLYRRSSILTDGALNRSIGYEFDVNKATWGKNFAMEITGGSGTVDLDIYFYSEFGTREDVVNDPGGAGQPFTVAFNTRDTVGEFGQVPADTTKVIVCMMAGGFNGTFSYKAGDGVKLP